MPQQQSLENLVRRGSSARFSDEYNCRIRRLFPWPNRVNTKRPLTEYGCMLVTLESGKHVDRHSHDEEEAFVVISGIARLSVDEEETILHATDVAYIPRNTSHALYNKGPEDFVMLDIYWDLGGGTG